MPSFEADHRESNSRSFTLKKPINPSMNKDFRKNSKKALNLPPPPPKKKIFLLTHQNYFVPITSKAPEKH